LKRTQEKLTPMLREVLFSNPQWVILGLLIWIPVGAMVFMLISGMIMDEIEPIAGILGLAAALGLGVLGIKPPDPSMTPIIFTVAIGTWVLLPFLRTALNRREHVRMRIEAVESAYAALSEKQNNLGAQIRLAKALFDQGMVGSAVGIAEVALQGVSRRDYADELRMLKHWKHRLQPQDTQALRCQGCGNMNPRSEFFCQQCHRPYLLDYARGWLKGFAFGKIVGAWAIAILLIVGIPTLSTSAPPTIALISIPILVIAAGILLWRSFFTGTTT
jgi:hypothetical protein